MHYSQSNRRAMIALTLVAFLVPTAFSAEWGSLKGRFVVEGKIPDPKPLPVTKDQFCIDEHPLDESIVVGEDGELANVVVFIRQGRRDKVEVHPDYAAQLSEPVVLDNVGCHFLPHVMVVRTGQPMTLKNSDPVGHNTNLGVFNQIIPSGGESQTKIDRASPLPISVSCNIHPFMKGFVLVQDHPYMAVSAADGTFEIENLPTGKRGLTFWHELPGALKDLKVGSRSTDRKGQAEVTIKNGETLDLGEIAIPAVLLK